MFTKKKIFKQVVTLDEFYYQLNLMYLLYLFLLHAVQGYTEFPKTASAEKKREDLGKCDNLNFKEKKSYLKG
jgi:hypothetical protein